MDSASLDGAASCASVSPAPSRGPDLVKRIGGTTYEVSFHFSESSKETFNDKIVRLIRRDLQNSQHS